MSYRHPFRLLLSYEEALRIVLENIHPIHKKEMIALEECFQRVLAENLMANMYVPPFDRSAMDGYAVKAEDTFGASPVSPIILSLKETVYAGDVPRKIVDGGECTQISTGCPIPEGANAVVMLEFTEKEGNRIKIFKPVYPQANISQKGEDIEKGTIILEEGTYLTASKVGVLAALGRVKAKVYKKPRVAVVPTGGEVRSVGSKLESGQVYDINSHTLSSVASENGALVTRLGIVPDIKDALEAAVKKLVDHDLIVVAGGSSVGERDLLNTIITELGTILFHGVQVKPGKPTLFGLIDNKPIIGMPGYPTSCLSNAYLFLVPAIRKLSRLPPKREVTVKAPLAERVVSSSGRKQFLTVKIKDELVYPVFKHSGAITSMAKADGYIILPTNIDVIEKGDEVKVFLLAE